jgi:sulfite reductase beta subunit-like hemoprotein
VASVFKRHGQFATRKHTRLKYVVDALGEDAFRREVEKEMGGTFEPLIPTGELKIPSWNGPHDQQDGEFYYGLGIPYGRIQDVGIARYKSAIRLIVETFRPRVVLSPDQNIIFAGLRIEQIEPLERILAAYHVPFGDGLSKLRFEAMACAGLPTCPLALAESERVAPAVLDELEAELERIGKSDSSFSFRISGCSIGCIRPNMVDLGAIGRKPGHYDLFMGGSEADGRFGELYEETVPLEKIVRTIAPVLQFWAEEGEAGESFSDFFARWFAMEGGQRGRLIPSEATPVRERVERMIQEFRRSEQTCLCA